MLKIHEGMVALIHSHFQLQDDDKKLSNKCAMCSAYSRFHIDTQNVFFYFPLQQPTDDGSFFCMRIVGAGTKADRMKELNCRSQYLPTLR